MAINISLAYAHHDTQHYTQMSLDDGTTIYQALQHSGWLLMPELADFATWCLHHQHASPNHKAWYVGIYSQKKRLDTPLSDGDRIEIYRPLSFDPMSRRKKLSTKNPSRRNKHQTTI
ncbi:MAG: RnfH family protein [Moraxella sp.]|uniref:RnfH family protein n=1 Tax=Moraxella sp. TaxID=479 RepID=UPI0026DC8628|nr:RnfH family protein [Moraxella sp.]MDO4450321.1 RnfH family protein [Moraxella sp.]